MNIRMLEFLESPAVLYKQPFAPFILKIEYKESRFCSFCVAVDPMSNKLKVLWTEGTSTFQQIALEIIEMIKDLDKEKFLRFIDNKSFKAIEIWS